MEDLPWFDSRVLLNRRASLMDEDYYILVKSDVGCSYKSTSTFENISKHFAE